MRKWRLLPIFMVFLGSIQDIDVQTYYQLRYIYLSMQASLKILKKTFQLLAISALGITVYCSYSHPIQLKGEITKRLFNQVRSNEKYCEYAFKFLLRFRFLTNSGSVDLGGKILSCGFDADGSYVQGLKLIGLSGVEIGPITTTPNTQINSIGVYAIKANLSSILESEYKNTQSNQNKNVKSEDNKQFKIGGCFSVDSSVMNYAPYLIPQNILNCINIVFNQQKNIEKKSQKTPKTNVDQTKRQNTRILDFITIDSHYIKNKIGQEAQVESEKMIQTLLNKTAAISQNKNIQLYRTTQNGHKLVYSPNLDHTRIQKSVKIHSFISWQDIVNQIIKQ